VDVAANGSSPLLYWRGGYAALPATA
jgi:hypothetical protein